MNRSQYQEVMKAEEMWIYITQRTRDPPS